MIRPNRCAGVTLVATLWLSACGASAHTGAGSVTTVTNATNATTTTTATAAATTTTMTTGGSIAAAACTLVSAAQVQALLARPPAGSGTEQDYDPTYKTCSWLTTPPPGGNTNSMRLAVVLTSATTKGFGAPSGVGGPTPVAGVGDSANFYATSPGTTFAEGVLIAVKGRVSVSIDLHFGGTPGPPANLQAAAADAAQAVFGQVAG
jgi:hypothetical protein